MSSAIKRKQLIDEVENNNIKITLLFFNQLAKIQGGFLTFVAQNGN
jgi:hypothetical protein